MAYSTLLGELSYTLTLDKTKFDQGVSDATRKIKVLEKDADTTGKTLKKVAKDSAILGGSLAALGGSAIVAGAAVGGNLGDNLQIAGTGMAVVGGALATIVPAMKGIAVVIDGTLIPSLIRLNAFLGPTGWIVIGVGAAAAAIGTFMYMQDRARDSMNKYSLSAEDAKKNVDGLNDAMREKARLEKELAGLPSTKEDLEFELAGAKLDERAAYEHVESLYNEGVTGTRLEQAGYSYLSAKRRRERIEDEIAGLGAIEPALSAASTDVSKYQAAQALNVPYEQTSQMEFRVGTDKGIYMPQGSFVPQTPLSGNVRGTIPDIIINIAGTVSDATFRIPLKDQTSAQGYTW